MLAFGCLGDCLTAYQVLMRIVPAPTADNSVMKTSIGSSLTRTSPSLPQATLRVGRFEEATSVGLAPVAHQALGRLVAKRSRTLK